MYGLTILPVLQLKLLSKVIFSRIKAKLILMLQMFTEIIKGKKKRKKKDINYFTWLSSKGCSMALADPAALKESLWYEPTGSKLYTAPFPEKKKSM